MAGPWERYAPAPAAADGPWVKYGAKAATAEAGAAAPTIAAPSDYDKEVAARVAKVRSNQGDWKHGITTAIADKVGILPALRSVGHSFTFGLDSKMAGAEHAIGSLLDKGGIQNFGHNYSVGRDAQDRMVADDANDHAVQSTAGTIAGALLNPVGAETGVARLLPGTVKALKATKIGGTIAKYGGSAIGQGVRAGALNGALTGAGTAKGGIGDHLDAAIEGGETGAAYGGVAGAALAGAGRAGQVIADHKGDAVTASRVAYERIAEMLGHTNRPAPTSGAVRGKMAYTPEAITRGIKATDAGGGDGMVMDYSPGMKSTAGYLARQPHLDASTDLDTRGVDRLLNAPQAFRNKVEDLSGHTDVNAHEATKDIHAARKTAAASDYSPEVMDRPFTWNDDLEHFFTKDNPIVKSALASASEKIRGDDLDPKGLGYVFDSAGDIKYVKVPNMRSFDYIKKGFDAKIGEALKSGDRDTARIISGQLDKLKAGIARSNPDYGEVLAKQRDFYQQANAMDLGKTFIQKLQKDPRALMDEVKGYDGTKLSDLRDYGITDAIMNINRANPSAFMSTALRNADKKAVLEHVMGGKKSVIQLNRFLKREASARQSDSYTAFARQSSTHGLKQAGDSMDSAHGAAKAFVVDAVRGMGFGGPTGATGNILKRFELLRSGASASAQDQMARILMSKGDGLREGIDGAKLFAEARKLRNARRAVAGAKAGQSVISGQVSE